jgi:hypothetical protein
MSTAQCLQHTVYSTLTTVHCLQHTVYSTRSTAHCLQHTVYSTLATAHWAGAAPSRAGDVEGVSSRGAAPLPKRLQTGYKGEAPLPKRLYSPWRSSPRGRRLYTRSVHLEHSRSTARRAAAPARVSDGVSNSTAAVSISTPAVSISTPAVSICSIHAVCSALCPAPSAARRLQPG